jgi:hypothetical protein
VIGSRFSVAFRKILVLGSRIHVNQKSAINNRQSAMQLLSKSKRGALLRAAAACN